MSGHQEPAHVRLTYLFYADTPRAEIERALAQIAEYAHERGWDLTRTDPPELIGGEHVPASFS
ncbi:hypothetical protein K388_07172 [Streptomyces sp. KhCrAH-43]|uniref:hypothetical protein n=1 Tax=unclassified Streptomyces TaxID=2593676 RepID=UPI000367CF6E|nr:MULTISPECIES: hypothetical protein [unclassified Streptomyces]MYS36374.1 hypothetical protein [Streptomyces sp. SID4920]MYX63937.1 hypothetical protein [Streptomyces sp. SID8373]RAJ47791.1 hypothetical protein K388_07172 [Streptomyces sp. KhCrAH-43]